MSAMLEAVGVTRRYVSREGLLGLSSSTVTAVDNVSLAVAQGEALGLVGESGCGKSTLARMLVALEKPDKGDILYRGQSLRQGVPEGFRQQVQMVFQDPYSSLNPRMSVGSAIAEPLAIAGRAMAERRSRVAELLGLVGLRPEHAARYPHEFSGGQRQRVAIARSLACAPELLVLDEPVSALDVSIQAQIILLLQDLQSRLGLTYVFISHDLAVVNHLCSRVAVMYLGRLVEVATAEQLYGAPAHPYTRMLLAAVPAPDPRAHAAAGQPLQPGAAAMPGRSTAGGCAFMPRCPKASPACGEAAPPQVEVRPGHWAACLNPHR